MTDLRSQPFNSLILVQRNTCSLRTFTALNSNKYDDQKHLSCHTCHASIQSSFSFAANRYILGSVHFALNEMINLAIPLNNYVFERVHTVCAHVNYKMHSSSYHSKVQLAHLSSQKHSMLNKWKYTSIEVHKLHALPCHMT